MGILRTNTLSGIGTDGPVFDGVTRLDTFGYVVPPVGVTSDRTLAGVTTAQGSIRFNTDSQKLEFFAQDQWFEMVIDTPDLAVGSNTGAGARIVFYSGYTPTVTNVIDYVTASSTGNAIDFGDSISAANGRNSGSCSSSTRGIVFGGQTPSLLNTIDFITFSSTGNASSFGTMDTAKRQTSSVSNSTRGIVAGGTPAAQNTTDYVTISSTGNAVDFGFLTSIKDAAAGISSPTRGIFAGGGTPAVPTFNVNSIDFVTISTLGDAQDFGDLTQARHVVAGISNATRGFCGGGLDPAVVNTIDFITIATLGNAVDFGDLSQTRRSANGAASPVRGIFGGGETPTQVNTIDYITLAVQSNAVDFGDLTVTRSEHSGLSNAHGGL